MKSGIDADILRRIVGNDPDFLREVLEDFVCHAQSEITAIRAAFVSQDAEQMKIPTHRFKGSASLIGARQVVEVCTRLEAAAGASDWPMIHQLMPRLGRLMQDIKTSANTLLGVLPLPCA
jgi:HPt (histidine-containing phosphotransfer) domain-containing protein